MIIIIGVLLLVVVIALLGAIMNSQSGTITLGDVIYFLTGHRPIASGIDDNPLHFAIVLVTVFLFAAIAAGIYKHYEQSIQIWMYNRQCERERMDRLHNVEKATWQEYHGLNKIDK